MKVAIIGSRDCSFCTISYLRDRLPENCTKIISGGARGIDELAEQLAEEQDLPFLKFMPDYQRHGKSAPLVRNRRIVDEADMVLAFWDFQSKGTMHTIVECLRRGVPVRIYKIDNFDD